MDFYFTIDTPGTAEYKDRGSKFLAYAFSLKNKEDFKKHGGRPCRKAWRMCAG